MRFVITLISFLMITIYTSCAKKTITNSLPVLSYEVGKGKCFTCPAYIVHVYNHQKGEFIGLENTAKTGSHIFNFSKVLNNIITTDTLTFHTLNDDYIGQIRDLPMHRITINGKTVRYQVREVPPELSRIDLQINHEIDKLKLK